MSPGIHKTENTGNRFHLTMGKGILLRLIEQIPNIKHDFNQFKTMIKRNLFLEKPEDANFY